MLKPSSTRAEPDASGVWSRASRRSTQLAVPTSRMREVELSRWMAMPSLATL